jgi:hypothetical protein
MIATIFRHIASIPMYIIIVISSDCTKCIWFSSTVRAHGTSHHESSSLCLVQLRWLTVQLPNKPVLVLFSGTGHLFLLNWSNILHWHVALRQPLCVQDLFLLLFQVFDSLKYLKLNKCYEYAVTRSTDLKSFAPLPCIFFFYCFSSSLSPSSLSLSSIFLGARG